MTTEAGIEDSIHRRTARGQRELLHPSGRLSDDAARLLARFTGYTDLRTLLGKPTIDAEAESALAALTNLGLIEPVDPGAPTPRPSRA